MSITAHCLVKNEENFIYYAIKSVINFVDQVMVFDTGSTDKTVEIIQQIIKEYPNKIIFEEKGSSDGKRHTELRQEMLDRTKTDWFMILDGDEVWTERGMKEALGIIRRNDSEIEFIDAPFYLCVGDIYHRTIKKGEMGRGSYSFKDFFYPRFLKITNGIHWFGDFDVDTLKTSNGELFCKLDGSNAVILKSKYWHMTQLSRSSKDDNDYSSGGNRRSKRRLTYFIIGSKVNEPIPEVFGQNSTIFRLPWSISFINFFKLIIARIIKWV
jgi:glycosyltransferase involved in cell wall biosynthesis